MLTAKRYVVDSTAMDERLQTPSNYRWNFALFIVDYVFFSIALSFANPSTVLPAFVAQFTGSAPVIGLVSTIFNGLWLLPQVVGARAINDKPRKKPYLMIGISGRVALWIIPLALWLGLAEHPVAMLLLFFVCLGVFVIPDALASLAWFDLLARAIPVKRRGRLIGVAQGLSGLAGLGAGAVVSLILASPRTAFPAEYALIFALAGVAFIPSTAALALLREVDSDSPSVTADKPGRDGWLAPLREDPMFRRLMVSFILFSMASLATPFFVIHATDELGLPLAVVGGFVAAQQVAAAAFGTLLGPLSDRWGPSSAIRIGSIVAIAGPVVALTAHLAQAGPVIRAYPLVYVALGAYQSASMVGYYNYLLAIAPPHMRPSYIGLGNTMMGVLTLAPVVGGWLLEATSYTVLFAITAGLMCLGAYTGSKLRPATEKPVASEEWTSPTSRQRP